MTLLGWLRAATSWLDQQGGFTQGIAVAIVALLGGFFLTLARMLWRFIRKKREARREAFGNSLEGRVEARFKEKPRLGLFDAIKQQKDGNKGIRDAQSQIDVALKTYDVETERGLNPKASLNDQALRARKAAKAIDSAASLMAESVELLSNAVHAQIYWHNSRRTGGDYSSADAKQMFSELLRYAERNRAVYDQRIKNLSGFDGWTSQMEQANKLFKDSLASLVAAYDRLIELASFVLYFNKRQHGLLGLLRRLTRKRHRP